MLAFGLGKSMHGRESAQSSSSLPFNDLYDHVAIAVQWMCWSVGKCGVCMWRRTQSGISAYQQQHRH